MTNRRASRGWGAAATAAHQERARVPDRDLVKATVPKGRYAGTWTGRVAVRSRGVFSLQVGDKVLDGISHKHCRRLQRADGHRYTMLPAASRDPRATAFRPALKDRVPSVRV